jgi:hypothetical protein
VADQRSHLTESQRADLATLLAKFPQLFSGMLGLYPHRKVHLNVDLDAKPVYTRPYSVAHNHRELFRQELDRLVGEGVVDPCGATDWASPTFITPKKDGRVRWVSIPANSTSHSSPRLPAPPDPGHPCQAHWLRVLYQA